MTRYFFNELDNTMFQLDVPPPDGQGMIEITEADFKAYKQAALEEEQRAAHMHSITTIPSTPAVDMEKLARVWRKMQDRRDEIAAKANTDDAAIKKQQDAVAAVMLDTMNRLGGTSLATAAGTVQRQKKEHVSASDWEAVWKFIVEHEAFHMVQKRLTSTEVMKWANANTAPDEAGTMVPSLPPGMKLFTEYKIHVKKPGARDPTTSAD